MRLEDSALGLLPFALGPSCQVLTSLAESEQALCTERKRATLGLIYCFLWQYPSRGADRSVFGRRSQRHGLSEIRRRSRGQPCTDQRYDENSDHPNQKTSAELDERHF